jgi:hypothetical protein
MMIRRRWLMWVMAVMLSTVAVAKPEGTEKEGHGELRKRIGQKMQAFISAELSSQAALDPAKTAQLQQTVATFMEQRQQSRANRREQMKQLRQLVQNNGSSDAQLLAQLQLVATSAPPDDLDDLMKATAKYLSPREQAMVVMAIPDVLRDAKQLMRKGRGRGDGDPSDND